MNLKKVHYQLRQKLFAGTDTLIVAYQHKLGSIQMLVKSTRLYPYLGRF